MSDSLGVSQAGGPRLPTGAETILVVDDEPRLRRVLSRRLTGLGYRVFEAENGTAAMAHIAGSPEIALLFTDVVMPGMTGIELAEAALKARPDLKVLFTSGYAEPAAASRGFMMGGWLKKPYAADDLVQAIDGALRWEPVAA